MSEVIIYDRSVLITDKKDIEKFLADPKGFLQEVGALDGIPEFNGVAWLDGKAISSSDLKSFEEDDYVGIKCSHLGIPYRDYCNWQSCRIK